jgi:hypothetical protein
MAVDCERFDQASLELLYGELDELTASSLRRHLSHCERCQSAWQKMVRTREAFHIDLEEPPSDLFDQIMAAEEEAMHHLPPKERLGRWVSIVAGYAMRPQLAMAALLLLMVGSSLVFVRGGPGPGDQVAVRETGSPVSELPSARGRAAPLVVATEETASLKVSAEATHEREEDAKAARTAALSAPADKQAEVSAPPVRVADYSEAMRAYQTGSYAEAERLFSEVAARGGEKAGAAALHEAHAARNGSGCQRASAIYDEVALRYRGTPVGDEASFHAANCYRSLGQLARARAHLEHLKDHPAYKTQVDQILLAIAASEANQAQRAEASAASKPASASAKAPAPAATAPPAAAAPAEAPAADTAPPSGPAKTQSDAESAGAQDAPTQ